MANVNVEAGQYFDSFSEFLAVKSAREDTFNEKIVIGKSSLTVNSVNSKLKGTFRYKEELKYTQVIFRCVHQGQFNSVGGKKQSTSLRNGCPVVIKLRADKVVNKLQVVTANLEHNHALPKKSDGIYISDRKLTSEQQDEVKKLIDLGAPVRKIQAYVSSSFDKTVKTKDIHNIKQKAKSVPVSVEEQVWALLEQMVEEDSGSHFSLFSSEGVVKILFFQTSFMKRLLACYPDVLYIDTTYCLNSVNYPVVVFMIVDGDNVGQCVGYACVKDERMVTLSVLYSEFLARNEGVNVKTVVVDKDASEIAAVRQTMPNVDLVLCRFHVCKSLCDAVRKYCPKREQERMKECVMRMVKCASEERFWECVNGVPEGPFKTYLVKNWLPVRDTWANYATKNLTTWGNKTNNFVERHNRDLKTVGSAKTSLPQFLKSLLAFHRQKEQSSRQKVQSLSLRAKVFRTAAGTSRDILSAAHAALTPYACQTIKEQLDRLHRLNVAYDAETRTLVVSQPDGEQTAHEIGESCTCLFFLDKGLPCWHVMAFCLFEGVDVVSVVPERYRKDKLFECMVDESEYERSGEAYVSGQVSVVSSRREKYEWEKRLLMKEVCRELVAVGACCGQGVFDRRMEVLRQLTRMWRGGKEVDVEDCLQFVDEMSAVERGHREEDCFYELRDVDGVGSMQELTDVAVDVDIHEVRELGVEDIEGNVHELRDAGGDESVQEITDIVVNEGSKHELRKAGGEESEGNLHELRDVCGDESMQELTGVAVGVDIHEVRELGAEDIEGNMRELKDAGGDESVQELTDNVFSEGNKHELTKAGGDESRHVVHAHGDLFRVNVRSGGGIGDAKFEITRSKGRPKGEGLTSGHFGKKRKRQNLSLTTQKRQKKCEQQEDFTSECVGKGVQDVVREREQSIVGELVEESFNMGGGAEEAEVLGVVIGNTGDNQESDKSKKEVSQTKGFGIDVADRTDSQELRAARSIKKVTFAPGTKDCSDVIVQNIVPSRKVRQRKSVTNKIDLCGVCQQEEISKDVCTEGKFIDWIDCDICSTWFHYYCVNLRACGSNFTCPSCKCK